MKVIVKVYEEREDYLNDNPDYAEVYNSITEALNDKRKVIRKIRKTGDFIGFRMFDTLGELRHELPSEPITPHSILLKRISNV